LKGVSGDPTLPSPSGDPTVQKADSMNGPRFGIAAGRNRSSSKMTKTFECWGADKPFANITEKSLAKTIGLAVSQH